MNADTPAADLLAQRVIVVTGAGDGIGRAVARRLAAHGATVVLLGKTIRKLERVYDEIEAAGGPAPAIYPLNLEGATPKDYADLAQVLETQLGRLDGVIHNAARLEGLTPLQHYSVDEWYKSLQVNLNAPFLLTQALLPLLLQAPDASVIFTADTPAGEGRAYWGAYGVAKGANQTLMHMLASELETNTRVRVNSIYPGIVRTELRLAAYPAADTSSWIDPETITDLYLYLCGPEAVGVSGQTLQATGWQRPAH